MNDELLKKILDETLKNLQELGLATISEDEEFISITELGWAQLEYEKFLQEKRKPS